MNETESCKSFFLMEVEDCFTLFPLSGNLCGWDECDHNIVKLKSDKM